MIAPDPRPDPQPNPRPDPPTDRADREREAAIRAAIGNLQDKKLHAALKKYFIDVPSSQRPSTATVIALAVQLLGLAGQDLAPNDAIILLAEARWSYEDAVRTYLAVRNMGSSSPLSSHDDEMSEGNPGIESGNQKNEASSVVC